MPPFWLDYECDNSSGKVIPVNGLRGNPFDRFKAFRHRGWRPQNAAIGMSVFVPKRTSWKASEATIAMSKLFFRSVANADATPLSTLNTVMQAKTNWLTDLNDSPFFSGAKLLN
jgi:hypothetical protein